jgi:hypothetical protein
MNLIILIGYRTHLPEKFTAVRKLASSRGLGLKYNSLNYEINTPGVIAATLAYVLLADFCGASLSSS